MSFQTNPESFNNLTVSPLEIPIKASSLFRQSFLVSIYVKNYLNRKSLKVVHYSSKVNFNFCFI